MLQTQDMNLMKLFETYGTDDSCREMLEQIRWPEGVKCPRCGGDHNRYNETRHIYDCASCGYQFSVITGTIFQDTHLALTKWFAAIYLTIESKKGMSANQMSRTINVSYKTSWYLCHRIRAAMHEASPALLTGTVEVDETYMGGKVKGKGRRYTGNKSTVAGAVQRDGDIRLRVISRTDRETLHGFIKAHVADDTKNIYTDQLPAYNGVGDENTVHDSVNHSIEEWVRGEVHTNTVEGVWSLFKRSIIGSYHQVSAKHLDAYLDELEWRFNQRKNPYLFRDTLLRLLSSPNLEYRTLIG